MNWKGYGSNRGISELWHLAVGSEETYEYCPSGQMISAPPNYEAGGASNSTVKFGDTVMSYLNVNVRH